MNIREYEIQVSLPQELKVLESIANNLWWAWNTPATALFKSINPAMWDSSLHNPIAVISSIDKAKAQELITDAVFMSELNIVNQSFEQYMKLPRWYGSEYKDNSDMLVAYFSAEYGIHESVQLYSGGLGILSGDHCKSTSDMGIPLIAVGLLYRHGYFHQYTNSDGWQQEEYPNNEFYEMPIKPVKNDKKEDIYVDIKIGDNNVKVRVWELQVGLMRIILLDSDLVENKVEDRAITGKLYDGETNMRIKQEMILGIAGCRALEAAGIKPTVYHLNEGHPAFVSLERIKGYVESGLDLRLAIECVRKSTLFTTHTPVPAGFDVFPIDMIKHYIAGLYADIGLNLNLIMSFGRKNRGDDKEPFNMAVCGINLSTYRNGVAWLHGVVSRKMFQSMWPQALLSEVPIGHVTNGIHLPTFMSTDMKNILNRYVSEDWMWKPYNFDIWDKCSNIPDDIIHEMRDNQRGRLVTFIRNRIKCSVKRRGGSLSEVINADSVLNPNALTIGFARRFATYKRAYLLFMDEKRLSKLVNDPDRPVQFIIAGKAHPKDNAGKEIIKQIISVARKPEFMKSIVFVEDYDIDVARYITRGVDVWLNNPRRPMEASGTSGMKASANGGLNLSILDGWWVEGANGRNGWSIGEGEEYPDDSYQDHIEGMDIYNRLERDVVPLFYTRDKYGMAKDWLGMIKENFKTIPKFFNSSRMLKDYTDQYYVNLHKLHKEFSASDYKAGKEYIEWNNLILERWDGVTFGNAEVVEKNFSVNEKITLKATINTNGTPAEHLGVFAVVEYNGEPGKFIEPEFIRLTCSKANDKESNFEGEYTVKLPGKLKVGFLVTPFHKLLKNPFELNRAKWA